MIVILYYTKSIIMYNTYPRIIYMLQKLLIWQVEAFDPTSVLNLELVEAMPRRLPLMIGKNKGLEPIDFTFKII